MSLITAQNLSKSFGHDDIFSAVSLSIPRAARIAIVGPNGVGKTTLLRILIGLDEPSSGTIQRAKNLKLGYLPQEAGLSGVHTLWEECLRAVMDLVVMEQELARLEGQMSDPEQAENALALYGPLQVDFERRGGYTYETRIRQTLTGLGFQADDYRRPVNQLSGGQRTRAVLARLLLSNPDLLILDEPTNHLDIAAVEWLEGYLSQWDGAILVVSHDRYFLDRVIDHIWEMSAAGLELYRGNYSAYIQQRQERWELRQQLFETEKERLLKDLDYVKRNIAGQRTQQAKGKLRRLSRQVEAIESLGTEALLNKNWGEISQLADISTHTMGVEEVERRIKSLRSPIRRPPLLHIHLKSSKRSGELVLRTYDVDIGYQDEGRPLFHLPDLVLRRGECAAIIGPNGAGKTTFLKTILAKIPPLTGEVLLGASLDVAYFAQAHEDLNPQRTLVEEIDSVAPHMLLADIRDYLARFLFSGGEVFKQVATLSGGERGRLALAKLSLTNANLLLLDEPTNHLDIPSQEILQEVLGEYQGTILIVSHDRYLIDALATQIWEIEPDEASMKVFSGSYSQYRLEREAAAAAAAELKSQAQASSPVSKQTGSSAAERRRLARLAEIEREIAELETQLAGLGLQLESPPADPGVVQRLGEDYVELQNMINALLSEWEQLHVQV
ncbi:MAG TPA: ABC-F family ATP-binding cassette domain-containing protein [Anaerolineales bacterium]|nr:ABC-F family ATP-binding cassette domain-containing protein [Anaerolineales bacterium]